MRLKSWYKLLLLSWAIVGLPSFVVGWGFAGHAPWRDIPLIFELKFFDPVSALFTLIVWACLISPFVLAPFGVDRKAKG
jgi:hypothetical protein